MKNTTLLIIAGLILIAGGIFIFTKSDASSQDITGNIIKNDEIQEITLSLKNYNYYPNTITVKEGIPVRISLDKSVTGCLRSFTIRDFGVAKNLRTPEDYVEFTPNKKGTFTFACSMGMGRGKLIVE